MALLLVVLLTLLKIILNCNSQWDFSYNPLPQPLFRNIAAYYSKRSTIYVFGGTHAYFLNGSNGIDHESNAIYKWNMNQSPAKWIKLTQTTATPFYASIQTSVTIGHLVYFIGTVDDENPSSQSIKSIYTFNMEQDQFESNNIAFPLTYPLIQGCLATNNSHIFMLGGEHVVNGIWMFPLILQIFDIDRNMWITENISLPVLNINEWSRQHCSLVADSLYVFGGQINASNLADDTNGIFKYNTTLSSWSYVGNISSGTNSGWSVYSHEYNRIYVVGGMTSVGVEIFDVEKETIITNYHGDLKVRVSESAVLIVDGVLMVFGGADSSLNGTKYIVYPSIQTAKLPLYHPTDRNSFKIIYMVIAIMGAVCIITFICCITCRCAKQHRKNGERMVVNDVQSEGGDRTALIN